MADSGETFRSSEAAESAPGLIRRRIRVNGVVQGVGFRPYIYRLALEEQLTGRIFNDTAGVTVEIEGAAESVTAFLNRLPLETPPLADIAGLSVEELSPKGDRTFRIEHSDSRGHVITQIPADAGTCDDCLRELLDPGDRRFRYPFINCTNCGPRFTITRRIPYDRPQTSMAKFPMCKLCQAEYDDPLNRRFHAQPNACWACGPQLSLADAAGRRMEQADPVEETVRRLRAGEIVAVKGIGGFHLAVDARNEDAVDRLRRRKRRFGKPFALMVRDIEAAGRYCEIDCEEQKLLRGHERPVVLLRRCGGDLLAPSVAPGIPWLGVFLPYAPLHHLLFTSGEVEVLVMTSANLSEEPITIDNDEAIARLRDIADSFLMHDREILQRCDDSVMQVVAERPQILRRARGFVPLPVDLPFDASPLLAVGGHLKNVFCLASGRKAYPSQHLGDLENPAGLEFFEEALEHLKRTFEIEPGIIVHDLHPGYLSTQWAVRQPGRRIAVQHHHSHIAGCMAEYALVGPVIGISLDGTGYGADGRVWGGEVLLCSYTGFQRFGHLKYVAMPGSEAAIREPWRMAFSHLLAALGEGAFDPDILKNLALSVGDARLIERMIARGVNSPLTSSCGRLFDAAAALIVGRLSVDYEAQAAIELEGLTLSDEVPVSVGEYPIEIQPGSEEWNLNDRPDRRPWQIDPAPLFRVLVEDVRRGETPARMSLRFHAGVATAYSRVAIAARASAGFEQVCLSGGVIHNKLLVGLLVEELGTAGFEVFLPRRVSPGDGGLSYGQAAIAAATLAAAGEGVLLPNS